VRVLQCIPSMEGGGAERQLTYLVGELHQLGVDVHVALVSRGPNWARLIATGATVHEMRARGPHDPFLFAQLFRTMRTVDPDLVQVWLRQMDVLGGLAAFALRKPLILTERTSRAAYPASVKHAARICIGRFASAIVANSEEGDRYWQGRANRRAPRYIIPNAIPVSEIAMAPPANEIVPPGRKLVLFAGRLEPEKNIDTLLAALLLVLQHADFDAVFCGVGTLKPRIVEWIEDNRLATRVRLIGYSPVLWGLMKRASVLISPSMFEGTPNVVLEAMACRCPLVLSDIPEHRALVDESTAILANPTSPVELASAIGTVLRNPDAAHARAEAAFSRVERFSPALIAQRYLDVYRTVLAQPCAAVRRADV
jgi:glycosyltransferase involved in cell wall biosynthesis